MKSEPFGPLDPSLYRETVRRALAEDLGWGDLATDAVVPAGARAVGRIVARGACVLAGLDLAEEAFRQLDPVVKARRSRQDGDACAAGDLALELDGQAGPMLTAERTALNFLRHLSGIATLTRRYVEAAGRVIVLDTRCSVPLLRTLERYAVRAGGGANHRATLDEVVVVTRTHARLAGGLAAAIDRVRRTRPEVPVEMEVGSMADADVALAAGADRLVAVGLARQDLGVLVERTRGRAQVRVDGDVRLEDLPAIAEAGPDFVSVASLVSAAAHADLVLEIAPHG